MYYGWKINAQLKYTNILKSMIYNGTEFNIGVSDVLHVRGPYNVALYTHKDDRSSPYFGLFQAKSIQDIRQDTNFARIDGSVYIEKNVVYNDRRFMKVPYKKGAEGLVNTDYLVLPKEMK